MKLSMKRLKILKKNIKFRGGLLAFLKLLLLRKFTWQLQGEVFETDAMLVPLRGYEMVLGVQWLATLGNILWNFNELRMAFEYKGRTAHKAKQTPVIIELLEEYADVFVVPTSLPLERSYDHKIVLKEGSAPVNIEAMKQWPVAKTIKQLRGFLGLTGYYRRFIKGYAMISHPLTQLLKRNSFQWNQEAQAAFEELKRAMIQAPVLKLPNFKEELVIETDASGGGIGAVLQQGGHLVAYYSKSLSPRHQTLSTYEKELLAVIQALEKWRGSENYAADALSRVPTSSQLLQMVLTTVTTDLLSRIVNSWKDDTYLQTIIQKLQRGEIVKHYTWIHEQLRRKGKIVVGNDEVLRQALL
ncbi:putative mitochondrial protein, partial [Tanacetum coccineum]